MIEGELDLCYVEATDLIRRAIDHVLSQESCDESLREKLRSWQQAGGEERKVEKEVTGYSQSDSSIPFQLVFELHKQLQLTPLGACVCVCVCKLWMISVNA